LSGAYLLEGKVFEVTLAYTSGSQSGRYGPLGGDGIFEVGANRYERWKGALLISQGALVDK
jgi:hypothetical protein